MNIDKYHQLIWSAAVASNATSASLYEPATIYCKDETGTIIPWPHSHDITFQSYRHIHYNDGESPLTRIAELFNVNHFIVSQARPYLSPFLRSELSFLDRRQAAGSSYNTITRSIMRLVTAELRHRLKQLDYIGLLPQQLCQFLIEDTIPAPNLTLVPDLSFFDFPFLFRPLTKDVLGHWILKGERGVWPAISALKVRCAIEVGLDKGYQIVRRRKPYEDRNSSLIPPIAGETRNHHHHHHHHHRPRHHGHGHGHGRRRSNSAHAGAAIGVGGGNGSGSGSEI